VRSDDWNTFAAYNFGWARKPRFVVEIVYDDENVVLTSHEHPKNLEGQVLEGFLEGVSSTSNAVYPIDGRSEIGGLTVSALDVSTPKRSWVYDLGGVHWFRQDGSRFHANRKTRIRAYFVIDEASPTTTASIFSVEGVLYYMISDTGQVRVYDSAAVAFTNTGLYVEPGKIHRAEIEWDGEGNFYVWLDGQKYSPSPATTYTIESPVNSGALYIGGRWTVFTEGRVWGVKAWDEGVLKCDAPMNEGHGIPREYVYKREMVRLSRTAGAAGWARQTLDNISDVLRAKINDSSSPANPQGTFERELRLYVGFTDDFDDYVRVITTYIDSVDTQDGEYTFRCSDVTKLLRRNVFERKTWRLTSDLDDGSASPQPDIPLSESPDDVRCPHTAAFTDAPSETVGYIKVKDTGEIIRYTGVSDSPAAFTGITRGVMGTNAAATSGDYANGVDNYPELEEVIYLEMPAPQLAYAVITGRIFGSSPMATLPDHWHMGVSVDKMATSEWEGIGPDLYDSDIAGLVLYFNHLKKTDGKKFVENEIHRLVGTYSPINTDGTLGLARINRVLSGSSADGLLYQDQIVSYTPAKTVSRDVINSYRIDYQWNGEKYLNSFLFTDADSVAINGASKTKVLKFKGLHTSRHSVSLIAQLINTLQDRYRNPPIEMGVNLLPEYNIIESNDVITVVLYSQSEFADSSNVFINRPFEVQRTSVDWVRGDVRLQLFASTGTGGAAMYTPNIVLADAFYTSKGTDIATMESPSPIDGAGNLLADLTLTGDADMTAAGAVYYVDGDFTVPNGVTLTVEDNVQLRVKGTFTVNGTVDGVGNGKAGATDTRGIGSGLWLRPFCIEGTSGFIGNTRSTDSAGHHGGDWWQCSGLLTEGQHSTFPDVLLNAGDQTASPVPADVTGVPTDMRGTSGATGAMACREYWGYRYIEARGGDGGDGGAGVCVIARGMGAGANGLINLSGGDGAEGETWTVTGGYYRPENANPSQPYQYKAGTGAGGGPGGLLVVIDGDAGLPDLTSTFVGRTGATVPVGTDADDWGHPRIGWGYGQNTKPHTGRNAGYADGNPQYIIDDVDRSEACLKVLWVPEAADG
jgi:hypothetical protein